MSNKTRTQTPTPTPASVEFGSEEAAALTHKQVKAFLAHTNNQPVINELETVLKSGRDALGWKALGRIFLEEIKEHAFAG